jgi:hypothetical protein
MMGFAALMLAADSPNMSGTWEMDAAKSEVTDGRAITLTIQQTAGKIKLDGVVKDKAGTATEIHFTCGTNGTNCDYDDAGHKAKVAVWFNGPQMIAAKTEGVAADAVNEWHMKLGPDGKVLTIEVEHIDPQAKNETLVFSKGHP